MNVNFRSTIHSALHHVVPFIPRWLVILGSLTGFVLGFPPAGSPLVLAQLRPVGLKELVERSAIIMSGRVIELREGKHPQYSNIGVTYVTLEVSELFKGKAKYRTRHEFMQFGGMSSTRIADLPSYQVGEDVMLFLYPESKYGFTSPVGGGQGKMFLQPDPQTGETVVLNALPKASFFEGIDSKMLETPMIRSGMKTDGRVTYRALAQLIRQLANH